jgi:hypothetical protein
MPLMFNSRCLIPGNENDKTSLIEALGGRAVNLEEI